LGLQPQERKKVMLVPLRDDVLIYEGMLVEKQGPISLWDLGETVLMNQ
jgi:hypothetical protein